MELEDIRKLAKWIADARSAVAFTGAGISTESGIPDFRSPGGVWSRHKQVMYDEFLCSREARARYWKMRVEAYREFAAARPNAGHLALAELELRGRLRAVITQNIDGLHQLAGSKRLIELHGTARKIACVGCGKEWPPDDVHAMIDAGNAAPDCDECAAPLKSKTISFGQAMPIEEMAEAERLAMQSDLFLAIGSSLVVEPAASLPRIAALNGATFVIINRDPSPLDRHAKLILRSSIATTMESLISISNSEI